MSWLSGRAEGHHNTSHMTSTAVAPSNIAFTKYWGKRDPRLNIPNNNSISMNLDACLTTTTVEFSDAYEVDVVYVDSMLAMPNNKNSPDREFSKCNRALKRGVSDTRDSNESESKNVHAFLDKVRELACIEERAMVVSKNNFPQGAGIASSASAAAALAVAATKAAGLNLSEKELSTWARLFSGSGCRSIPAGFVEWHAGTCHEDSYAESIAPPEHWDLLDIIAVVGSGHKKYGSTVGHGLAETSFLYEARLRQTREYNPMIKEAILARDFKTFGNLVEREAMSLHAVMITSDLSKKLETTDISIRYWNRDSMPVMRLVEHLRSKGVPAYFTIDAGPNIHILTLQAYKDAVTKELDTAKSLEVVEGYIVNKPGGPTRQIEEHLF